VDFFSLILPGKRGVTEAPMEQDCLYKKFQYKKYYQKYHFKLSHEHNLELVKTNEKSLLKRKEEH